MLNQIVIVGRLTGNPEVVKSDEEGKERSQITLAVPRSYKNADGEYDTDFVDCVLWGAVATNTAEYCHQYSHSKWSKYQTCMFAIPFILKEYNSISQLLITTCFLV